MAVPLRNGIVANKVLFKKEHMKHQELFMIIQSRSTMYGNQRSTMYGLYKDFAKSESHS